MPILKRPSEPSALTQGAVIPADKGENRTPMLSALRAGTAIHGGFFMYGRKNQSLQF
nr:MAG TPA: hypothetical protein [Caudoviricetes sp.]